MDQIEKLCEYLRVSSKIVAFTGAGVSTESDIPDFRSAGGVYDAIQREYGLPAEQLLSHDFFEAHPDIFFDYLKKYLIFPSAKPNDAHRALAALERSGRLSAVVTQNIDGLHQAAGSKTVYELHGSLHRHHCVGCGRRYGLDFVLAAEGVPRCESCGGVVRPDVVLYGEQLEGEVVERAVRAIGRADLMVVIGTSLAVYPAAGLLDYFRGKSLVLINKSVTPRDGRAALVIRAPAGETMRAAAGRLGLRLEG